MYDMLAPRSLQRIPAAARSALSAGRRRSLVPIESWRHCSPVMNKKRSGNFSCTCSTSQEKTYPLAHGIDSTTRCTKRLGYLDSIITLFHNIPLECSIACRACKHFQEEIMHTKNSFFS